MQTDTKFTYPLLNPKYKIHFMPDRVYLEGIEYGRKGLRKINRDAGLLLTKCDGATNISDIVSSVVSGKALDIDKVAENIQNYLYQAQSYGDVIFLEEPSCQKVKTSGSLDHFYPISVSFEITTLCNEKCAHCYRSCETTPKEVQLERVQIMRALQILYENGVFNIEITGGDPFMNIHIEEILEYCCKHFATVTILTNGTLVRDRHIDMLEPFKEILLFQIPLESIDPSVHDAFRGLKGSYKLSDATIRKLTSRGFRVRVACNITPYNIEKMVEHATYVHDELKAWGFSLSPIVPIGRAAEYIAEWGLSDEGTVEFSTKIASVMEEIKELYPGYTNVRPPLHDPDEKNCGVVKESVCISPDGNVRPCVMCNYEGLQLGNLLKDDYAKIFNNELAMVIQQLDWPDPEATTCEKCEKRYYCHHCIVRAINYNVDNAIKGIESCEWIKHNRLTELVTKEALSRP